MVEGNVFHSNMDSFSSFSGNLFAVLVSYLEVEGVGLGMVVGNVVYISFTGDMTIMFF